MVELDGIPEKVEAILAKEPAIRDIAEAYKGASNALFLGRGYNFPVALEGALKLKEISYIHAEGYPAAEMKHGPIALIDENMPVFIVATQDAHYEKVLSNIQEVKARGGRIIALVTQGDREVAQIADHVIEVHRSDDALVPMLSTIPFQLLSYHIAVMLDRNVDQPRNLAKSVTVCSDPPAEFGHPVQHGPKVLDLRHRVHQGARASKPRASDQTGHHLHNILWPLLEVTLPHGRGDSGHSSSSGDWSRTRSRQVSAKQSRQCSLPGPWPTRNLRGPSPPRPTLCPARTSGPPDGPRCPGRALPEPAATRVESIRFVHSNVRLPSIRETGH